MGFKPGLSTPKTKRPPIKLLLAHLTLLASSNDAPQHGKRYLILDRDTKYTEQFRRLVREAGTEVIRLPPRSPNLNAHAERFVRSIQDECLNRMIFVGQGSLCRAVSEYMTHYHEERNHQGGGQGEFALPRISKGTIGLI